MAVIFFEDKKFGQIHEAAKLIWGNNTSNLTTIKWESGFTFIYKVSQKKAFSCFCTERHYLYVFDIINNQYLSLYLKSERFKYALAQILAISKRHIKETSSLSYSVLFWVEPIWKILIIAKNWLWYFESMTKQQSNGNLYRN